MIRMDRKTKELLIFFFLSPFAWFIYTRYIAPKETYEYRSSRELEMDRTRSPEEFLDWMCKEKEKEE